MPDGRFVPLGDYRSRERAALWRGEQETRAELIEAGKERALAALAEFEDALSEIEIEAPGSLSEERSWLPDLRSGVRGVR